MNKLITDQNYSPAILPRPFPSAANFTLFLESNLSTMTPTHNFMELEGASVYTVADS